MLKRIPKILGFMYATIALLIVHLLRLLLYPTYRVGLQWVSQVLYVTSSLVLSFLSITVKRGSTGPIKIYWLTFVSLSWMSCLFFLG